jgi:hypothetical protein
MFCGDGEPYGRYGAGPGRAVQGHGADRSNPDHQLRRLLSEFIGMAGLTFVLSGGAAILARYGGRGLQPWQTVLVLSAVSALWLVVAVYFLGDISAHFNPAPTGVRAAPRHALGDGRRPLGRPVRRRQTTGNG